MGFPGQLARRGENNYFTIRFTKLRWIYLFLQPKLAEGKTTCFIRQSFVFFGKLYTDVTRLREISPLCSNLKLFWLFLRVGLVLVKTLIQIWQFFVCYWDNSNGTNGQILYKKSSHLVTLVVQSRCSSGRAAVAGKTESADLWSSYLRKAPNILVSLSFRHPTVGIGNGCQSGRRNQVAKLWPVNSSQPTAMERREREAIIPVIIQ